MEYLGRDFLSEPPPDHFSSVCMETLTEPYLTDCGHHFCNVCCRRLLASGKTGCPAGMLRTQRPRPCALEQAPPAASEQSQGTLSVGGRAEVPTGTP